MGQPGAANPASFHTKFIGGEGERGEVKHLSTPRNRNQSEIPSVVASERGRAQTGGSNTDRVVGLPQGSPGKLSNRWCSRRLLERTTREGESPVSETSRSSWRQFPSTAGHVKPRGKLGRPFSKAKYLLATDSELVP